MPHQVLVYTASHDLLAEFETARSCVDLVFCSEESDALRALRARPTTAVVWHVGRRAEQRLIDVAMCVRDRWPRVTQLIRFDELPDDKNTIDFCCSVGSSRAILSIAGRDRISDAIDCAAAGPPRISTDVALLERLATVLPGVRQRRILVAATLLGYPPANVATLARLVGCSTRRLRRDCDAMFLPQPSELLRWSFVLRCLAEIQLNGTPIKALASRAGLRNPEAITNRVSRLVGARVRRQRLGGGFQAAVDRFVEILGRSSVDRKPIPRLKSVHIESSGQSIFQREPAGPPERA